MSEAKRHHFVPKGYLREFGIGSDNNLTVFTQRMDLPHFYPKIEQIGKALCSEDYYNRINPYDSFLSSFFGTNPNIIEDKGFPYERQLPDLFLKLNKKKLPQISFSLADTNTLINALISIKFRNPYTRETYKKYQPKLEQDLPKIKEEYISNILDQEIIKVSNNTDLSEDEKAYFNAGLHEYKRRLENDFSNPEEFIQTIHKTTLYLPDSSMMVHIKTLGQRMMNCRWEILQTGSDKQFITSDNPGVYLTNDNNVYAQLYHSFEKLKINRFFFPLSGLHGLIMYINEPDIPFSSSKLIKCFFRPKAVMEYNTAHCCHANKILIGSSKDALEEAFNANGKNWVDVKTRV